MAILLVLALTLVCGLAVVIIWNAVSLLTAIVSETLEYIFRFEER